MHPVLVGAIIIVLLVVVISALLAFSTASSATASTASSDAARLRAEQDAREDNAKLEIAKASAVAAAVESAKLGAAKKEKELEAHYARCTASENDTMFLAGDADQIPSIDVSDRIDPFPVSTDGPGVCKSKCMKSEGCQEWVWTGGEAKQCYMINKTTTHNVPNKGFVSGRCAIHG